MTATQRHAPGTADRPAATVPTANRGRSSRPGCLAAVLLAIAILPSSQALAADDAARLAATCTGCHGTDGHTAGDALPPLAGQPIEALLASLRAFKAGERSATVMTQIAKGYSGEQLERIAGFFARQPLGKGAAGASGAPAGAEAGR